MSFQTSGRRRVRTLLTRLAAPLALAGCIAGAFFGPAVLGDPEPAPSDLCALVGQSLIDQLVPGPVRGTPHRSEGVVNSVTCAVTSDSRGPASANLEVRLDRFGACRGTGRGVACNPARSHAMDSLEQACKTYRINQEGYGRYRRISGLGERACSVARTVPGPTRQTIVNLVVQAGGDVVTVGYLAAPSSTDLAGGAARAVAGNVLARL